MVASPVSPAGAEPTGLPFRITSTCSPAGTPLAITVCAAAVPPQIVTLSAAATASSRRDFVILAPYRWNYGPVLRQTTIVVGLETWCLDSDDSRCTLAGITNDHRSREGREADSLAWGSRTITGAGKGGEADSLTWGSRKITEQGRRGGSIESRQRNTISSAKNHASFPAPGCHSG